MGKSVSVTAKPGSVGIKGFMLGEAIPAATLKKWLAMCEGTADQSVTIRSSVFAAIVKMALESTDE